MVGIRVGNRALLALGAAIVAVLLSSVMVLAQSVPPRVAVLARADNPVDALAASSVAAQLGGVVLLTPSDRLGEDARQGLIDYAPTLVVLAGGNAALAPQVEADVAAIPLPVRRVSGPNRLATARALSALPGELGASWVRRGEPASDSERLGGWTLEEVLAEKGAPGPEGPQGATGPTGPTGPVGISGLERVTDMTASNSNDTKSLTVSCPPGKRVLGGGFNINIEENSFFHNIPPVYAVDSYPNEELTGWLFWAREEASWSGGSGITNLWRLRGYAVCAVVDS